MIKKFKSRFTHYFIPHESNNYKAKSLHVSSLIFYALLLFTFQSFTSLLVHSNPNVLGYATDITVEKILYLINQERQQNMLVPLSLSPELSTAATEKASDMFSKNYWAHVSPTGTTPWEFINKSGYQYLYAGENLAKSFDTSEQVVEAWLKSSTHRANILKPEYTDIGLSVMNGVLHGEGTTLVVQEFGTKVAWPKVKVAHTTNNEKIFPPIQDIAQGAQTSLDSFIKPKTLSILVSEFMLVILFIDSLYMWRYKTSRVSSRSVAHIIFIVSLLSAMGATGIGVIL